MRVIELIKKVRFLISERDPAHSFVSDNDLINFINNALKSIVKDVEKPQTIIKLNITPGNHEYILPVNYYSVIMAKIVTETETQNLRYVEYEDLENFKLKGRPVYYYLREHFDLGQNLATLVIGFYPSPDKEYQVEAVVVVYPAEVTNIDQVIPLPDYCYDLAVYKVLQDIYEADKRYDIATYYNSKYQQEVSKIKTFLFNRVPDYVD